MSSRVITKIPGNACVNKARIPQAASKDKWKGSLAGRRGEREKRHKESMCTHMCKLWITVLVYEREVSESFGCWIPNKNCFWNFEIHMESQVHWCALFLALWQCNRACDIISLKRVEVYFGSQFQRFQSMTLLIWDLWHVMPREMSWQGACVGTQLFTSWQSGSKETGEGTRFPILFQGHASVAQFSLSLPHF